MGKSAAISLDDLKKRALSKNKANTLTVEFSKVQAMAAEYEKALRVYTGKIRVNVFKNVVKLGSPSYAFLARATRFAEELDVSYETYIEALFHFSDKWGNRAPKVPELASYKSKYPAKDRVESYLTLVEGKQINPRKVVGIVDHRPIEVAQSAKDAASERQLRVFMKNFDLTEEEVLKKFATGLYVYYFFDLTWLMKNETYLRLKKLGEV